MRIDGTSIVPGAAASGEKRRKDERAKFTLPSGSANAAPASSTDAITPPLEANDVGAMIALQEFSFESSGDADEDAIRETDHLIDMLQHMQESLLNTRPTDTEGLRRQCDMLRIAAKHAAPDIRNAAAAALTRADIELAKRHFPVASGPSFL